MLTYRDDPRVYEFQKLLGDKLSFVSCVGIICLLNEMAHTKTNDCNLGVFSEGSIAGYCGSSIEPARLIHLLIGAGFLFRDEKDDEKLFLADWDKLRPEMIAGDIPPHEIRPCGQGEPEPPRRPDIHLDNLG